MSVLEEHLAKLNVAFLVLISCLFRNHAQAGEIRIVPVQGSSPSGLFVLTYDGSGPAIAGLQFDVHHPEALLIHVEAGEGLAAQGKQLQTSRLDSSRTRVLLFGINRLEIASGELARVRFEAPEGIPQGPYSIELESVSAVDVDGRSQSVQGVAGDVQFPETLAPLPTAPFPLIVSGGGWETDLVLTNPLLTQASGRVRFQDQAGSPLSFLLQGRPPLQFADFVIPPLSTIHLETHGLPTTIDSGWLQLIAPVGLTGHVSYRKRGPEDKWHEASTPLSAAVGSRLQMQFDHQEERETGLAVANPGSDNRVRLLLTARDLDGIEHAREQFELPPGGQLIVSLLQRYPALAGRTGILEVQTEREDWRFVMIGLQFDANGSFRILPASIGQ